MILEKVFLFVSHVSEAVGGQAVSIPFPKGLATCHSLNGQRRFSDPVAGAYK